MIWPDPVTQASAHPVKPCLDHQYALFYTLQQSNSSPIILLVKTIHRPLLFQNHDLSFCLKPCKINQQNILQITSGSTLECRQTLYTKKALRYQPYLEPLLWEDLNNFSTYSCTSVSTICVCYCIDELVFHFSAICATPVRFLLESFGLNYLWLATRFSYSLDRALN